MRTLKQKLKTTARATLTLALVGGLAYGLSRLEINLPGSMTEIEMGAREVSPNPRITDMDGDSLPDVISYAPTSYGSKQSYIFKEGYGPARSGPEGVDIEFMEKQDFYTYCESLRGIGSR